MIFEPESYGPEFAKILGIGERLSVLGPGTPDELGQKLLRELRPEVVLPKATPNTRAAVMAGLWLYVDDLDASHRISQDLSTAEGSFLHAIMHRREPDAWNSKYWFRQVDAHPVVESLRQLSPALGYEYRSPAEFVELCERVRDTGTPQEQLATTIQRLEWRLLFDHCYRLANA